MNLGQTLRRIAYLTDSHFDEQYPISIGVDADSNWQILLNDVANRNVDSVFFGGDIGASSSHQRFFDSLSQFRLKICLGNHDTFLDLQTHIPNLIQNGRKELYYSFEDDFFKHIVLDSSSAGISQVQFEWLRNELQTDKKILLFIHHPVFKIETAADEKFPLAKRIAIQDEIANTGNQVFIFCGHYHMEDESINGNVTQFVTPASSYCIDKSGLESIEVKPESFGYRIIELEGDVVSTQVINFKSRAIA